MTEIIADLQLHSKYSRAVSQQMVLPEIEAWAKRKGIGLIATGDWTHPLWFRELKEQLVEDGDGLYKLRGSNTKVRFILSGEISSIYSQDRKTRRIHNLILVPSIATVEKINKKLVSRGCNLMSDGRPIIGLTSKELLELVLEIDERCIFIPAHCLLADEKIHVNQAIQSIKDIKKGNRVYTHKNRWQKVEKVFARKFEGKIYQIIPDYFRLGIKVTGEHPFWAIKTRKYCRSISKNLGVCKPLCSQTKTCARNYYEKYKPEWIQAKNLEKGDVLVYPRFTTVRDKKFIKISDLVKDLVFEGKDKISLGGYRRHKIVNEIRIDKAFCRLAGYYLAEGYTSRDLVSFCFGKQEKECLNEIKKIFKATFAMVNFKEYTRKDYQSTELTFYSKVLHKLFSKLFYTKGKTRKANNKCLPIWMLELPPYKQKELLQGWWRGDKGYTTSRLLMNQMKVICLRLGIIPSIGKDTKKNHKSRGKHDKFEKRNIKANFDTYHFSHLSFFEDPYRFLKDSAFKKFRTRMKRRRGWMDKDFIYHPIRAIKSLSYKGMVYNLEVAQDNSYTAEFACIHNCWTPWYSLYGSMSGFDSLEECFGNLSKYIYAIETGLSSDPAMNWRIKELDHRMITSSSDAHSGPKLGREATVFKLKIPRPRRSEAEGGQNEKLETKNKQTEINFSDIRGAIMQAGDADWEIGHTIEFYPEEGKYHYSGHRNCNIRQSPEETKRKGTTCSVCGKPLTLGVMHRVDQLAARSQEDLNLFKDGMFIKSKTYPARAPYVMLVPLVEILAESMESTTFSQKVAFEYEKLTNHFNGEFNCLMRSSLLEIAKLSGEKVAEGVQRVREGKITILPGYDGVFGTVKIWGGEQESKEDEKEQLSLF